MVHGAVPVVNARSARAADEADGGMNPVVLIALGNEERRDDGIGGYVADLVASRCAENVPLLRLDGLEIARIPELVAASPRTIVVVDAWRQHVEGGYQVFRSAELPSENGGCHAPDIREYATLTAAFGCHAEVHTVLVSAGNFGYGRGLSASARRNACRAALAILGIFRSLRETA